MTRNDAVNLYESLLAKASITEVATENRLTVLKACWALQAIAAESHEMCDKIILNLSIDGKIPQERVAEANELLKQLSNESVDTPQLTDEQKEQLIVSNPSWTIEHSRIIMTKL